MTRRLVLVFLLSLGAAVASGQGVTPEGPNLDDTGDPVPQTVKARFGTLRFRLERDVADIAISPDGKTIATRGANGLVVTFDAATGKELHRMRKQHGAFLSAVFSPDGSFVATGTSEGVTGLRLSDLFERFNETGHQDAGSNEIAFSPDGKTILSWGSEQGKPGILRLYSGIDGKLIWERKEPVLGTCAFSPDSKTFAIGIDKEAISLREAKTGNELGAIAPEGGQGVVKTLAYSKDGRTIAAWARGTPRVRFHDAASGAETKHLELAVGEGMDSAAFAPSLATGAFGKDRLVLVDLKNGKTLRELAETTGRDALVHVMAFTPDGKTVYAGRGTREASGTARIQVFDVATGADVTKLGSREPVEALAFSPSSTLLAMARNDGVEVRDVALHKPVRKLAGHGIFAVAFSPDGKTLAAASRERVLLLGEKDTEPKAVTPPRGQEVAAFSMAANLLLARTPKNDLALLDMASGKTVRRIERKAASGSLFAFSPEGKVLALATPKTPLQIISVATGKSVREVANAAEVLQLAFSSDGKTLAFAVEATKNEPTILVIDVEAGSVSGTLKVKPNVGVPALACSPDGKRLAQGSIAANGTVYLWDPAAGTIQTTLAGQTDAVFSLAFSPDGKLVAAGSADGTAVLYDLK